MMKGRRLDTIYIGGGTPTTLEPHQLRKTAGYSAGEAFGFEGLAEFTVEAGQTGQHHSREAGGNP